MKIKQKFELVYGSGGNIGNVISVSNATLSAYKINKSDKEHLDGLVKIYARVKNHNASNFVVSNLNKVVAIDLKSYPLPGFLTVKGIPVININSLSSPILTDFSPADLYAMYLYVLSMKSYVENKNKLSTMEEHVSAYIFAIFMKIIEN
jgi:hypothetical protein